MLGMLHVMCAGHSPELTNQRSCLPMSTTWLGKKITGILNIFLFRLHCFLLIEWLPWMFIWSHIFSVVLCHHFSIFHL
jgi:hypothetical protein